MTITLPRVDRGTTRLILVRHGEPDDSVRGRCYGRLDPGLSPRGREQMRGTWEVLRRQPVEAIYSSPSRRAVESAGLRGPGALAVAVDERLREIDFGAFEGLAYGEIAARHPREYEEWMTRPTEVTFPRGESFTVMSARVHAALERIRQIHRGETVVVVAHGGVNRVALAAALDLDPRRVFRLDQAHACLNVIDHVAGEPIVRLMNATVPLPC